MEHTISTENVVKAPVVPATPGKDREHHHPSKDIALETLQQLEREKHIAPPKDDIEPKKEEPKPKVKL